MRLTFLGKVTQTGNSPKVWRRAIPYAEYTA
jgi:hypothetical protein